jgi:two-component system, NarL family, nitrate/nitrite response regulator NarL
MEWPVNTIESTINLLLLDDHAMFRQGLARLFEKEPGFKVVGQCASAAAAIAELPGSYATMILLDVDLGAERAIDFIADARKKGFKGHILVVTAGVSDQVAIQLVQAGVAGILHKHHSTEALCAAIRQVAAGEAYLEKTYTTSLFRSIDKTRSQVRPKLTDRDKVVLRFIFQGLTNREISLRLQISESGVKSALRQLFDKLGVRTRAQLVKVALEQYRDQL